MTLRALAPALFALVALVSTTALAQPSDLPVVEHDFTDADRVEASLRGPEAEMIRGERRIPRRSLIRPRTEFIRELVETADHR